MVHLFSAVLECLEASFPGLALNIQRLENSGYFWKEISTPFVIAKEFAIIAHAGVLEMSLVVEGERKTWGAIHAVCTHPSYRHQGFAREVVREAVEYCRERYENVILFTDIPELYTPCGFSPINEHMFRARGDWKSKRKALTKVPLRMDDHDHVALFHEMTSQRYPLSNVFSCDDTGATAAFFCLQAYPYCKDLYYVRELEALIACTRHGSRIHLFDIFSKNEVDMDALLACFDPHVEEIFFFFSPDKLSVNAEAVSFTDEGCLMALQPELMPKPPFMVPLLSRC